MESRDAGEVLRPIIVGQAPSRISDPGEPLSGRSGARLAALCGLTLPDFLARFERINLVPDWQGKAGKGDASVTAPDARDRAGLLRAAFSGRRIVVLGAINAAAFGLDWPKFSFRSHWGGEFAWSPHPSGFNLFWNDPIGAEIGRQFWSQLAQESDPAPSPLSPASSAAVPPARDAPISG